MTGLVVSTGLQLLQSQGLSGLLWELLEGDQSFLTVLNFEAHEMVDAGTLLPHEAPACEKSQQIRSQSRELDSKIGREVSFHPKNTATPERGFSPGLFSYMSQ